MLVGVWLAGVTLLTVPAAGGLDVGAADEAARHAPPRHASCRRWSSVCRSSSTSRGRVRLLESSAVVVPTVIGWLQPVILLPVSALAGLSPTQIEAILAHELAHIRRHDYLVNLLQTLLETLLFYHPAVWWLSRSDPHERENCCDDLAVSLCGDPVAYARALADLEEHRGSAGPLVMAASGGAAAAADPSSADRRTGIARRPRSRLARRSHRPAARRRHWDNGVTTKCDGCTECTDRRRRAPSHLPHCPPVCRPRRLLHPPSPARRKAGASPHPAHSPRRVHPAHSRPECTRAQSAPSAPSARRAECTQRTVGPSAPSAQSVRVRPAHSQPRVHPAHPRPSAPSAPSARSFHCAKARRTAGQSSSLSINTSGEGQKSRGSMSWSNDGEKLEVKYEGEFEFSDDDTDVKRMSPGAQLRISDGGWFNGRSVEFSRRSVGQHHAAVLARFGRASVRTRRAAVAVADVAAVHPAERHRRQGARRPHLQGAGSRRVCWPRSRRSKAAGRSGAISPSSSR